MKNTTCKCNSFFSKVSKYKCEQLDCLCVLTFGLATLFEKKIQSVLNLGPNQHFLEKVSKVN